MKKALNIIFGILLVPAIAIIGGIITDKINGTFVSFKILLVMGAAALIMVVVLHYLIKLPKFCAGAIVIGILLTPYMQFLFGKIDIFLMDPPNLRPSVSVPEIRVQIGELSLFNEGGEEIVVLPASSVHTLYPGKNIVNLGKLNIPAGSYKGGKIGEQKIEIDIYLDMGKEVELAIGQLEEEFALELAMADELNQIPEEYRPQIPTEIDMIKRIRGEIDKMISREMISGYLPSFATIKEFTKSGDQIKIVLSATMAGMNIPIPSFPYPTGTGGPDITLDIVLNEIGLPVGINPIINLPPGAPEINIPNMAPNITVNIPNDFGVPESAFQEIRTRISEGLQKAEQIKKQIESMQ